MTRALLVLLCLLALSAPALSQAMQYERPVDTAPREKDIGGGYTTPEVQKPLPRGAWLLILDFALLGAALAASVWLTIYKRSRRAVVWLSLFSLVYFGFYREGCVCPVGSLQNVAVALTDPNYRIPILVTATFFLPLIVAALFGRAFCGGVCALGAIQEFVLIKPVRVPRRLDQALGLLKYAYLGAAIWFAIQPAASRDFLVCRFDPFVSIFRRTGFAHMYAIGAAFLIGGMFVGRPYCRYLCPYGGLLSWCARLAPRGVSITPGRELDCGLCNDACPYGAIEKMRADQAGCLYCARCYRSCPVDRKESGLIAIEEIRPA
ncbi:MAG: 4Fe-4S binding protein [Bryobacteraceae bacterium]|nr:4Fe-4S binding protein [Bryobacteraceae bacterium]